MRGEGRECGQKGLHKGLSKGKRRVGVGMKGGYQVKEEEVKGFKEME